MKRSVEKILKKQRSCSEEEGGTAVGVTALARRASYVLFCLISFQQKEKKISRAGADAADD